MKKLTKNCSFVTKNSNSFYIEKNAKKEEINLHIAKVSGEEAETTHKKTHNAMITRIGKKKKEKWKLLTL